jgi:uncharacterized protein (TIGR03000 family)
MYSVVIMAALTTSSASPDCCFRGGWYHNGAPNYYHTGYGTGCYGCYGGYYGGEYGRFPPFYTGDHWSPYGPYTIDNFGGLGSGYGGYYGGGGYGGYYGVYGCAGCYGGWSGYGSNHGGCYGHGGYYGPVAPMPGVPYDKMPEQLPNPKDSKQEARAKVVVEVPAQAKLYIDDQLMPDKAGKRTFVTPPLQSGQTYYYDVKLVTVQDGREIAQTTRVILRPGELQTASFGPPAGGTATASASKR